MRDYRSVDIWKDVDPEDWNDWKWQIRNRIVTVEQLSKVIRISREEQHEINLCLEKFRMAITPYYSTIIDQDDANCPIKLQAVPSAKEMIIRKVDMIDPLGEEKDSPVGNIVHRYPDRILFLLTHKCSMYCRHCTRRRVVGEEEYSISKETLERAIEYIKSNSRIRDVLLSGGDPFVMTDAWLERILRKLREIPHVEIIRIGTRTPVVLPMRITDDLVNMLRKYHPIWINTHFNHPRELTGEAIKACEKIVDSGIPLGNQSVLLKGVNDNTEILKDLFLKLAKARVRPYYLYQCDVAQGIGHFRTKVETGIDIIKNLRGYISGYAVPTFVIDAPGGGGKIPVNPEYVISMANGKVKMRNYRGEVYCYPDEDI